MGALGCTSRTLRGVNGTGIGVSGCSNCVVSFMGLLPEFPILVCDLASGMDAIIGTDVLGLVVPCTHPEHQEWPAIHRGRRFVTATSKGCRIFRPRFHSCSVPPYSEVVLHCTVCTAGGCLMPSSGLLEGLTVFVSWSTGGSVRLYNHIPCTFVTFWIRYLGTWAIYNIVNWRASYFVIQICSLFWHQH